jgi:class 3 adenylate cyclase/tetratricopeptide (TPR) repeat protein
VVFCDLVGSTELAERLDPEELRDLMRAYRGAATAVVARYDGHVAQYLGDGLMVYFGWPVAHEDDAERGIRAALDVVESVGALESATPLAVRLGVATGTVVVGDDASGTPEAQLAVGETPNLAARLQGLARANEVVIAPATRRLVGDAFELTDLGASPLKGLSEPVQAWRVESVRRTGGRFRAARGASELSPLVGREDEMAKLAALWEIARSGAGQVVLLGGEPGIGKSRLTHALLSRVASEGAGTLLYQCSPYHLNSALHPFIAEMESAAGFTSSDTPERKLDKLETMLASRGTVAAAAPLLAPILSLPAGRYPALALSSRSRKEKTLEVLGGQVETLAGHRPVLVVFEDAHWIDPTSQEALERLVMRLHHVPALLIVTHRPEYAVEWPDAPVTSIGLSRLAPTQGAELVHRVTGGRALPPALLERIVVQTDGVPLFVEELTKSVLESGVLRESGDRFTLDSTLPALAVPTSLRDSLLARLDRLAPVKDLVQIGACIGREFSYQLLSRITRLDDDRLQERLSQLTDSGLLFSIGSPPDARYVFKHALVQDVAYDSLLKGRRQELHARIVQVLERDVAAGTALRPELLAHHHTQAGNTAAAVPWWRDAGKLAVQRLGVREAVALFEKALALLDTLPPSTERDGLELSIREPLNAALTGLRGWAAAEVSRNASVILELTRRRGSQAGTGLWAIWVNTTTQGRIADSLEWAQRLLAEGEQARDLDLRILGHGASMISHFYLGQLLEARDHGNRVLELYDSQHAERWMQVTAHDLKTLVGVWSCQWTWMLGYPDQAIRLSDEKDLHARAMGEKFNLEFALTLGAYAFVYRREPERLFERLGELEALEREQSVPFMDQVMVPQLEGLARLCNGQPAEAASALARGLENWNARGGHSRVPYLKATLAEAVALQNDCDAGLRLIEECLQQIEQPGWQERSHLAEVLRLKGWMLMRQNRTDAAEEALRRAIDWARQQQARSWELRAATTLAELLAARGNHAAARDLLAPIYGWFTEGFETHDLAAARAMLEGLGGAAPAGDLAAG